MQGAALGDDGVQTVRYWLYAPGERAWMWDKFRELGVMGLAWGDLGDLAACASKHDVQQRMLEAFPWACSIVCVSVILFERIDA